MQLPTCRDVVQELRTHPGAKSADANGEVCTRTTVGLLGRRVVRESFVAHVGKEANRLEEVETGLERDPEVVYTEYRHPARDPWIMQVLPVLWQMPQEDLAHAAGLSVRRLRDVLNGTARPRSGTLEVLCHIAAAFGRTDPGTPRL